MPIAFSRCRLTTFTLTWLGSMGRLLGTPCYGLNQTVWLTCATQGLCLRFAAEGCIYRWWPIVLPWHKLLAVMLLSSKLKPRPLLPFSSNEGFDLFVALLVLRESVLNPPLMGNQMPYHSCSSLRTRKRTCSTKLLYGSSSANFASSSTTRASRCRHASARVASCCCRSSIACCASRKRMTN